jgi:hypothetical protein
MWHRWVVSCCFLHFPRPGAQIFEGYKIHIGTVQGFRNYFIRKRIYPREYRLLVRHLIKREAMLGRDSQYTKFF